MMQSDRDGISFIWIHNPPYNHLSRPVRTKLLKDIEEAIQNDNIKIIVLAGSGHSFSVGADIKEMANPWPVGEESHVMASYVDAYKTHNVSNVYLHLKINCVI